MVCTGRILIADDEPVFLGTTSDLLKLRGYQCDCVGDAAQAAQRLRQQRYDLLISDIKMPGNCELELIKQIRELAGGTPVILVTAHPSVATAVESHKLPVADYLLKPVDFDELFSSVQECVKRSQVLRNVETAKKQLINWCQTMQRLDPLLEQPADNDYLETVSGFVATNLKSVAGTLEIFGRLAEDLTREHSEHDKWELIASLQLDMAYNAIVETIRALKQTKQQFKSKRIAQLRRKLQVLVDEWPKRPGERAA